MKPAGAVSGLCFQVGTPGPWSPVLRAVEELLLVAGTDRLPRLSTQACPEVGMTLSSVPLSRITFY